MISSEGEPSDADEAKNASSEKDIVKAPVLVMAKGGFCKIDDVQ